MDNKIVRYATIGTGWITEAFIDAASTVDGLMLQGVYSRDISKANEFAKKHNALFAFDDINSLVTSDEIDAIYIASPNVCHYDQSKLFLQNKKHVICEKPITISKEQAIELFEIAKENGVIFMEAIMAMHMPQLGLLEEAIKQIGRVSLARFDFSQLSSKYPALLKGELPNIFNIDMYTGCIMDIGIYCIYLALRLFPDFKDITAKAVNLPSSLDLCGTAIFEYDDKLVNLTYSKIADGTTFSEIHGDKGTIVIDMPSQLKGISIKYKNSTENIYIANEDDKPMRYEAQSFYEYITAFDKHSQKYEFLSNLCIKVSDTLAIIRQKSGVNF